MPVAPDFIAQIFTEARTHRAFADKPVSAAMLRRLYDIVKFAPTSGNICPMRVSFIVSAEGKAKLLAAADEGNRWRVLFLLNIGYGSGEGMRARGARLGVDEACEMG